MLRLQGELERLQQELKEEEAEAVSAEDLSGEVCVFFTLPFFVASSAVCGLTPYRFRLRLKLYRQMGFTPCEESGIYTKVLVRTSFPSLSTAVYLPPPLHLLTCCPHFVFAGCQRSRDARTVQLDSGTSDYQWSEFLWELVSK